MNSTTLFRFSLILLLGAIFIVIFTSYGNKKVHPGINKMIVDAFLKKNNLDETASAEFINYSFLFGTSVKGVAVIAAGTFSSVEGPAEGTVSGWIIHGGFSADEPELPASLRHFYDPTDPPGSRYLSNITDHLLLGPLQWLKTNPKMDGVDWALGKPRELAFADPSNHLFTWENGKVWMRKALMEKDNDKRNELMGRAWRALGETLHMIADNGCPAHVRDDAHPSPLWTYNYLLGDPNPYEEYMDMIRNNEPDVFEGFSKGTPNADLKSQLDTMKTARAIAHELAVYTNRNFVTNETISGKDKDGIQVMQYTNVSNPYPAPLLENMTYNKEDQTYSTASGIKQCVGDVYFSEKVGYTVSNPYVDMECVKSQAKALVPNIIAAGVDVMQLFIPKLKIELQTVGKSTIKGTIKHIPDPEYPKEIKYNGDVIIYLKDKDAEMIREKVSVIARNGFFELGGLELKEGDQAWAEIDFGGVSVASERVNPAEFKSGDEATVTGSESVKVEIFGKYVTKQSNYSEGGEIEYDNIALGSHGSIDMGNFSKAASDCPVNTQLKWNNRSFSSSYHCIKNDFPNAPGYSESFDFECSGEITPDNKCNFQITGKTFTKSEDGSVTSNFQCRLINVPFSKVENLGSATIFFYEIKGSQIKSFMPVLESITTNYTVHSKGPLTYNVSLKPLPYEDNSFIKIQFHRPNPSYWNNR